MSVDAKLDALFAAWGAEQVDLPVLYPADPFLEIAGEDIRRRMFVTEGPQGERLALRPDFTIPVCLAHLARGAGPARYAYRGLVFRRHDQGAPERLETGCEDIGDGDRARADADVLALAAACAEALGAPAAEIRLGDIGVFDALVAALGLPGRWRRRLRRSLGLPSVMTANLERLAAPRDVEASRLDPEIAAALDPGGDLVALIAARREAHGHASGAGRSPEEIAERFRDLRSLPDEALAVRAAAILRAYLALEAPLADASAALASFTRSYGLDCEAAIAAFAGRGMAIAERMPSVPMRFEGGFGRPLDYYTGLVFELRAAGLAAPLVGGGRYDRMMEMLGASGRIPAVGFTLRLDLIEGAS